VDNFLDFPVDLSNVLFICTANDMGNISKPLLDRMIHIDIPGYSDSEKE
jgi:ATP-dependent Lon protease